MSTWKWFRLSFWAPPIGDKHYQHFLLYFMFMGRVIFWIRNFNGEWKFI